MVLSSSVRRSLVVVWEALAPVLIAGGPTIADEVPDPSETPLSSVSEKTVSSVGTSEGSGEASSTCRLFWWETPVSSTTVGGPPTTTVDKISTPSEIPISASATPEGAKPLVTGLE
jgi:hypothetical protein